MITRREIYLDCNATHPLLTSVREGLAQALLNSDAALGNPSSIHRQGQKAKKSLAELREVLCCTLGRGDGDELVFLSGATEAINLTIRGFCADRAEAKRQVHLITSNVEHAAVLDTIAAVGAPTTILKVDQAGQLNADELIATLESVLSDERTDALVCLQLCNNETGVAFDLDDWLPKIHARFGQRPLTNRPKEKGGGYPKSPQRVWVLLDAAQALGKFEPARLRRALHFADYLALSAHKMGGPAGIGALWVRPRSPFKSQITGGMQEKKRRAGTLNALGALGFKLAAQAWLDNGEAWRQKLRAEREALARALREIPGLIIHGLGSHGELPSLLNTLNFHVEGCPEESLLLALDLDGFCVSSGSACNSGSLRPSHVLLAMGYTPDQALSSIRVCTGVETTPAELEAFVTSLRQKVTHIVAARKRSAELLPEIDA